MDVLIQQCNFTGNRFSYGVKLLEGKQCLIVDSNFGSNFVSVYTTSVLTKFSRCNFSNHYGGGNCVYSGEGASDSIMVIEDSHVFNNTLFINGAINSINQLIVTRSVFRNNTVIETPNVYLLSGAAIFTTVLSY